LSYGIPKIFCFFLAPLVRAAHARGANGGAADPRSLVQTDADIVRALAAEARIRRAVLRRDDPNYRLANMSQAFALATAPRSARISSTSRKLKLKTRDTAPHVSQTAASATTGVGVYMESAYIIAYP
jgi:hypothetical protein